MIDLFLSLAELFLAAKGRFGALSGGCYAAAAASFVILRFRGLPIMRIALIEDHHRLANSIVEGLASFGFGVDAFATAADGIKATRNIVYDGIVLDLGLPDRDGVDVVRELRDRDGATPLLILTARDGIDDRVTGLDAGADDYVLKPFAMKELAARLRALLRRPGRALGAVLKVGKLRLDVAARQASVNGADIRFSAREVAALELLMRREGQVISKAGFEKALYGVNTDVSPNAVEVLISRLRRRLETANAGCSIHTLYGIGYLLKE
jgi:DNA-binding response OmpR family regulator